MQKHIIVISQYFYPEQFRINDICSEWVKRGYKVTVITGIPNYPQGKFYKGYGFLKKRREVYNGVNIIRIPIIPRGRRSLTLILNYLSFVVSGYLWKVFTRIKADYVFTFEVSPMTQALLGVWYAKKRKVPCYLYVQDLWPENVEIVAGISNKFVLRQIGKMVDYIYKRCDRIFTTSQSFLDSIAKRNVPIEKLEYWPQYAEDFYVPLEKQVVEEIPNDDIFNLIFTGNIGEAQGLDILPKAAKILNENNINVRFNIIGDGRYKDQFKELINSLDVMSMFNLISRKPATDIPKYLAACDAAFLSLTNNPLFLMTIPAKLQSYMACGMPVVAAAGGETKKILEESKTGLCSDPGDYEKLAYNLEKLITLEKSSLDEMRINSRKYYDVNFNRDLLLNKIDIYFNV